VVTAAIAEGTALHALRRGSATAAEDDVIVVGLLAMTMQLVLLPVFLWMTRLYPVVDDPGELSERNVWVIFGAAGVFGMFLLTYLATPIYWLVEVVFRAPG
jgi:hypothetical protein